MYRLFAGVLVLGCLSSGCAATDEPTDSEAFADHAVASDFEPAPDLTGDKSDAVGTDFDRNRIVSDAFFVDSTAMGADQIQAFLEDNPYGGSSWLAWETVDGQRVSDVIAEVSVRHDLNPMMLLSRFQVEGSHISGEDRPSDSSVQTSLGCGCHDGQACYSGYSGLALQIDCAAETLATRYGGSVDGSWEWRKGHTMTTNDGLAVTPRNHATAALYAYTPWVLVGRGGNWLVWNVLKKYVNHVQETDPSFGDEAWVGTPCQTTDDCGFGGADNPAFCYDFVDASGATRGFCSVICEGYCPESPGEAGTFCIPSDSEDVGFCVAKSQPENDRCQAIPGTVATERDRFVGADDPAPATATVCAPAP